MFLAVFDTKMVMEISEDDIVNTWMERERGRGERGQRNGWEMLRSRWWRDMSDPVASANACAERTYF